jgi:hypothetical protein
VLEFTDADDPNTTPPASSDIVRALAQQIGGTALGGPANVLSFGVPAQMKWCRVKATDLTGGQTIKVVTYGQEPPPSAQLPIAATVTQDFRAAMVQSIEKGRDISESQVQRFRHFAVNNHNYICKHYFYGINMDVYYRVRWHRSTCKKQFQ